MNIHRIPGDSREKGHAELCHPFRSYPFPAALSADYAVAPQLATPVTRSVRCQAPPTPDQQMRDHYAFLYNPDRNLSASLCCLHPPSKRNSYQLISFMSTSSNCSLPYQKPMVIAIHAII